VDGVTVGESDGQEVANTLGISDGIFVMGMEGTLVEIEELDGFVDGMMILVLDMMVG